MNKNFVIPATVVLLVLAARLAQAGSLPLLNGIELIPEFPTTSDNLIIEISGLVPSTGYSFPDQANVNVSGQSISIDIFAQGPIGIVFPVVLGFSVPADVGMLAAGEYTVFAALFVDGALESTLAGSFEVVVPVPAAAWLFLSALLALFARGSKRGRTTG